MPTASIERKQDVPDVHVKARTEKPKIYPNRFAVPDEKVQWSSDYAEYQPPYFVAPSVLDNDRTQKKVLI